MTRCLIAALALLLMGPFLAWGGLWATTACLVAFFAVRAFWLPLFLVGATRYTITSRHVTIRREGYRALWVSYPLADYFLQEDFGLIRIFAAERVRAVPLQPVARLPHLSAADRAMALTAAGQVPRRSFLIPHALLGRDIASLLPWLMRRAGINPADAPHLLWQGQPASAPMVIPAILPAMASILLFAGAAVAAVKGRVATALWVGAWSVLGMLIEVAFFRWQTHRGAAARYALAGRYAIRIEPGL